MILDGRAYDLFVYGTLMDERIRRQLLRRPIMQQKALLFGYRRVHNADAYPYLAASGEGRVDGMILRQLKPAELRVLDLYEEEGRLYRRVPVRVRVGGLDHPAFTYIGVAESLRHVRRSHFDALRARLELAQDQRWAHDAG